MPVNKQIQLRRDTTTNWNSVDPILTSGEVGLDTTVDELKIGDGSTRWSALPYYKDLSGYSLASHNHNLNDLTEKSYTSLTDKPEIPSIAGLLDETTHDLLDHTGLTGIPAEYTLPTASTTVLGGVKVDGTTVTITEGVISSTATGGVTDHSALSGLADDDHTQYLNETRHDLLDHSGLTGIPSIAGLLDETAHDLLDHFGLTGIPTQYTDEMAQDAIGAAIAAGTQTGITVTYDDANNKINFTVTASGVGDVTGPASSVDSNFALFNGTTGKVIKDGGVKASDFATASHDHTSVYEPANANIQSHISSTSNQHPATSITNTPAGNISATTVQAAINELDTEKAAVTQLHDAVTVADSTSIDLTLTGQQLSAAAIFGTTAGTISEGNHGHSGVYEPADATILKDADIGVTIQAYDADLDSWSGIAPTAKQDTLISGTNIKTINSTSILGSGDIVVTGGTDIPYQNDAPSTPSDGDLWVDKDALPAVIPSVVDLTSATTDYALSVGETATITYTSATSVPLHVTTGSGIYELVINQPYVTTNASVGSVNLLPNNTSYTNLIVFSENRTDNAVNAPDAAASWVGWHNGTSQSNFPISYCYTLCGFYTIFTSTNSKCIQGKCIRLDGTSALSMGNEVFAAIWKDTTTPWTSLGTITFPFAQSGKIVIRRII